MQVIVKTIDGKSLTLENPQTGEAITWPIEEIIEPLEVGSTINLHLTSNTKLKETHDKVESSDQDILDKRKLLEQLVN